MIFAFVAVSGTQNATKWISSFGVSQKYVEINNLLQSWRSGHAFGGNKVAWPLISHCPQ
jgi:hypothetical protein